MTDRVSVSHITDDMVDKAARAHAENDGYDWPEVSAFWQERYRRFARVILSAVLAGCTVVDPPQRERVWDIIATVRDGAERTPQDAETDDIIDALVDGGVLRLAESSGGSQVGDQHGHH